MTAPKHTPGPWLAERHGVITAVVSGKRRQVANAVGDAVMHDDPTTDVVRLQMGNAHLIAAAPELLAELREARAVAIALLGAMPPALQRKWPGIVARAKRLGFEDSDSAAIAKAEGRS